MTYETMDWEAEAKRVARAFGLVGICKFADFGDYRALENENEQAPTTSQGLTVEVTFHSDYRFFYLYRDIRSKGVYLFLEADGRVSQYLNADKDLARELAKGLFHLELLNPEVENVLVALSAHDKLEWALEYENDEL